MSFGVLSTPGASADDLRMEVLGTKCRTPDAVCVLAPGNNLTSSPGICAASADFNMLLSSVKSRWPTVGIFLYLIKGFIVADR